MLFLMPEKLDFIKKKKEHKTCVRLTAFGSSQLWCYIPLFSAVYGNHILKNHMQQMKILSETYWVLTDLISGLLLPHDETLCCLCLIENVLLKMGVFLGLTWFILFVSSAKLLEEAVAEAVAEAEVVEEEEGAQDGNFSPCNCYQILGNFGYFFVQVLFMVSIFNKLKCEKVVFPLLVKSGEGGMSCF